jgi:hypothetical protein
MARPVEPKQNGSRLNRNVRRRAVFFFVSHFLKRPNTKKTNRKKTNLENFSSREAAAHKRRRCRISALKTGASPKMCHLKDREFSLFERSKRKEVPVFDKLQLDLHAGSRLRRTSGGKSVKLGPAAILFACALALGTTGCTKALKKPAQAPLMQAKKDERIDKEQQLDLERRHLAPPPAYGNKVVMAQDDSGKIASF